jgi:hypothetical protein
MSTKWTTKPPPSLTRINWAHPINKKLIGCWLFNEGLGRKVFDYARKNHASLTHDVVLFWRPDLKVGYTVAGYSGSTIYIDVPFNDIFEKITTALTIEVWYYHTVLPSIWMDLLHRVNTAGSDDHYGLLISNSNAPTFIINPGTNSALNGTNVTEINKWNHMVGTWDGTNQTLYMNGTDIARKVQTGTLPSCTRNITIGSDPIFGQAFNGKIGLARLWNRALLPHEIRTLYQNPYEPFAPRPQLSFKSPTTRQRRILITF